LDKKTPLRAFADLSLKSTITVLIEIMTLELICARSAPRNAKSCDPLLAGDQSFVQNKNGMKIEEKNTSPPVFHWAQLRPPCIGIEAPGVI